MYVDWRRFSHTFISSYSYMRGPVKIHVSWPKKSMLAENTLENTQINVFESNIKCLELKIHSQIK